MSNQSYKWIQYSGGLQCKILGLMIDNKLNWLEHIKCVSRKIAKGTGIIIKARKSFEFEILLNLYNALILPHISHCVHILGNGICSIAKIVYTSEEDCSYNLWCSPQNAHRTAL